MAMLMLDDVFARTWGERIAGPDDDRGYWRPLIESVRATHPDFVFWAEAYWDLEPVLVEQGFDACYDKRLYDRMVHHEPASSIRAHLGADADYQRHMLRFVENHDEPRAASLFDRPAHQAALTSVLTLPGVALLHEGEAEGRQLRTPVTLGRRAIEPTDGELRVVRRPAPRRRVRRPATGHLAARGGRGLARQPERRPPAWRGPGTDPASGTSSSSTSPTPAPTAWSAFPGPTSTASATLVDLLSGAVFERDGHQMMTDGLYVALDPDAVHLLHLTPDVRKMPRMSALSAPIDAFSGGVGCRLGRCPPTST